MRKLFLIGMVVALVVAAAGCKLVVTPNAPNGWSFVNEGSNGSGYFVNGPGNPPAGRGSALLTIDGTGREDIATGLFSGRQLDTFTTLKYSTYQAFSGSPNETLYLAVRRRLRLHRLVHGLPGPARVRAVGLPDGLAKGVAGLEHDGRECVVVFVGQRWVRVPPDRQ